MQSRQGSSGVTVQNENMMASVQGAATESRTDFATSASPDKTAKPSNTSRLDWKVLACRPKGV